MPSEIPEGLRGTFARAEHPYLMWDALHLVPAALEDALAEASRRELAEAAALIAKSSLVHLVGCGTSYFAAQAGAYAFRALGQPASAHEAFEFLAYPPPDLTGSIVIAISHTGTTAPVVSAVHTAKEAGVPVIGLTDSPGSSIAAGADVALVGRLGTEPALPKTRSYVSALLRHDLLALEVARRRGRDISELARALADAPRRAAGVLAATNDEMAAVALKVRTARRVAVVGGGPNWATAQEAALKLTETARIVADAWEVEEAGHGQWAATEPGDWFVVLALAGAGLEKARRVAEAMKAIGSAVWIITDHRDPFEGIDQVTRLPAVAAEWMQPLFAILPLYLVTYGLARARGLHPDTMGLDDPRRLAARTMMRR
jgi:glucosamine--fructose-6-phosphate aminotransferase (isomerizing)